MLIANTSNLATATIVNPTVQEIRDAIVEILGDKFLNNAYSLAEFLSRSFFIPKMYQITVNLVFPKKSMLR